MKKHYKAIADIIYKYSAGFDEGQLEFIIELADYFERDNLRFDKAKFLEACGVRK